MYVRYPDNYLAHHGILGMKWGVRRYQNADGSRTDAGKKREKEAYISDKTVKTYNKLKRKQELVDYAKGTNDTKLYNKSVNQYNKLSNIYEKSRRNDRHITEVGKTRSVITDIGKKGLIIAGASAALGATAYFGGVKLATLSQVGPRDDFAKALETGAKYCGYATSALGFTTVAGLGTAAYSKSVRNKQTSKKYKEEYRKEAK